MKNQKYYGILPNFDFSKINKDNFPILIEKDLFNIQELSWCYKHEGDYFGLELETIDWVFSDFFLFNRKEYHLKKEIYDEMYQSDRNLIEDDRYTEDEISEIDYELEKEFDNDRKLIILEYYYKKYFSGIKDREVYLLYKNKTKKYGCSNFAEYYKDFIENEEDFSGIAKYLQGKGNFYNLKLKEDWELMNMIAKVCDFCVNKKRLIENPKSVNLEINESESIFADDGYKIFSFLESKYTKTKNKAFFSYLYSFLQENNKIIQETKDSKEYRKFINKNFKIDMSRIIETSAYNQSTKDNIFKTFLNLMKSYSVNS